LGRRYFRTNGAGGEIPAVSFFMSGLVKS